MTDTDDVDEASPPDEPEPTDAATAARATESRGQVVHPPDARAATSTPSRR